MRSFAVHFAIGTAIGLAITLASVAATGQWFWWMAPVVGLFYGTLRAMHDEEDTQ
jgi:hypothetical protein